MKKIDIQHGTSSCCWVVPKLHKSAHFKYKIC